MAGKVYHLRDKFRAQPKCLTARQTQIKGNVRPHRFPEPVLHLRRVIDIMGSVPAVALAQDAFPVFDPGYVRALCAEHGPGRPRPDGGVATEVVDVGVGDKDKIEVSGAETRRIKIRQYDRLRSPCHASVHEKGPLIEQEVLREGARPQDAFYTVYARCDFHFSFQSFW